MNSTFEKLSFGIAFLMKKRYIGFDLIRGIGVLIIAIIHSDATLLNPRYGFISLDAFFVLSGFLVSGLLFREYKKTGSIHPGRFFLRRGFKIYPLFFLSLFLYLIYYYVIDQPFPLSSILPELFFYQNYRPGVMVVSWSLAVEEHFYLLLLLFIYFLVAKKLLVNTKLVPRICSAVIIGCIFTRLITFIAYGDGGRWVNDFPTHLKIDAPAWGVLLSYFYHFQKEKFENFFRVNGKWSLIFGLLFIFPIFLVNEWHPFSVVGYTLIDMACALLVGNFAAEWKENNAKRSGRFTSILNSFAFIGRCSYAIYLIHFLVGPASANFIKTYFFPEMQGLLFATTYIAGSIVAGVILTRFFERPLLVYRNKYFPQPGRSHSET